MHQTRCFNCNIILVETYLWCSSCEKNLSQADTWYILGFMEAKHGKNLNLVLSVPENDEMYRLGLADGKGEESDE